MNLKPNKLGAEPKKLGLLILLGVVAIFVWLYNRTPGDSSTAARTASAPVPANGVAPNANPPIRPVSRPTARSGRNGSSRLQEFRPSLKPKDMDRSAVDPTLHMDLLAKLQKVPVESGGRSLFQFGQAPVQQAATVGKEPAPIHPAFTALGPPAPAKPAPPAAPPPPPPIPLKFYGWVNPEKTTGPKRAFFLDGDDIVVASEGELIKKRYKIVRIGLNSAVVEDTQFKDNQQTLPLEAEQAG